VDDVGSDVTSLQVGDHVFGFIERRRVEPKTSRAVAEYAVVDANLVFVSGGRAGGVGIHAFQIAKSHFGGKVVATTAKIDFCKQYGADIVVDYKTKNAGEMLKGWADVVFDTKIEVEMGKLILKESAGSDLCTIADFLVPNIACLAKQIENLLR
jgi:NADPH:quinone reductase-like Zn-dependent oxidoreductase